MSKVVTEDAGVQGQAERSHKQENCTLSSGYLYPSQDGTEGLREFRGCQVPRAVVRLDGEILALMW